MGVWDMRCLAPCCSLSARWRGAHHLALFLAQAALERGLVLDDFTIQQLIDEKDSPVAGQSGELFKRHLFV